MNAFRADHPLMGTWFSTDIFRSSVEYTVISNGDSVAVTAIDTEDGEIGEIGSVNWDGNALFFAVHWSTGRYVKCRMVLVSKDTVSFTYTYTSQEVLQRKM